MMTSAHTAPVPMVTVNGAPLSLLPSK